MCKFIRGLTVLFFKLSIAPVMDQHSMATLICYFKQSFQKLHDKYNHHQYGDTWFMMKGTTSSHKLIHHNAYFKTGDCSLLIKAAAKCQEILNDKSNDKFQWQIFVWIWLMQLRRPLVVYIIIKNAEPAMKEITDDLWCLSRVFGKWWPWHAKILFYMNRACYRAAFATFCRSCNRRCHG